MRLLVLLAALIPAASACASEVYREKCALCHDSGATSAPRAGRPGDWTQRAEKGYPGLLRSALHGVPGSAMLPKAGFPELREDQVAEAVRYLLASVNLPADLPAKAAAATPEAPAPRRPVSIAPVDDVTLAVAVADALVLARIGGVQVESRGGHITLKGVVNDKAAAERALKAAQGVAGVKDIENRLVTADIFEHD